MFAITSNQQDNSKEEDGWEKESKIWQEMAGEDCLKHLGPISKEEYDYYEKLVSQE